MACQFESNRRCFTFIWVLENFEYFKEKTGQSFFSPAFIVDTIERTKWSLWLYPKGKESETWISLYFCRGADSKGPAKIEIDYELAFLAFDGSVMTSKRIYKYAFLKGTGYGFPEFEKRESVITKRSMYLPRGALTIRCRMWKNTGECKIDGQCIARTRIDVERKAFLWKIQNFSTFGVEKEITYRLKSTADDKPIMSLKLFLRKRENSHDIHIKFNNSNQRIAFSTFKTSLVDFAGHYVDCGKYEFWFSPTVQSEVCMLSLSKETLMENNYLYLPNNILTLYCECAFSSGILSAIIEETSYGCCGSVITNNIASENIKMASTEKSDLDASSDLKMDLNLMLQDNILCDVKLCTDSEIFPAHWFILSARSPVFRAMFKSDMKEKAKDRIVIEDLKPDTVRRMLLYMYTDSLEELQWETASDLYVAAEKYQIMTLKEKCSSFLKTNLSLTNACEVLLLADLHQDKELKSTVQDFILKNDKSIINSSEWNLLMETNVQLAAETLVLRYKV